MNALNSFDKTSREYSLSLTDDLFRFWRSKVKVVAGRWGGKGIHVNAGALKSIFLLQDSRKKSLVLSLRLQLPWIITSPVGAVAKYCNERICMSVCLSVCPRAYLLNHTRDLYQFFVHVTYRRGSVLLRRGDTSPRGRGNFRGLQLYNFENLVIYRKVGQNFIFYY